jgi:hypothetical protein
MLVPKQLGVSSTGEKGHAKRALYLFPTGFSLETEAARQSSRFVTLAADFCVLLDSMVAKRDAF